MIKPIKIILILCVLFSPQVYAGKLSDSNILFDWAETNYPDYFSPSGQHTFAIEGYLARYYPEADNYLGTKNDRVYVLGMIFGGLQDVGALSDYLDTINNLADETPEEGLSEILNLYRMRDFETLVRERYAELYKAKTEADILSVIALFGRRFSNNETLDEVISFLAIASEDSPEVSNDYEPQISETGEIAVFMVDKETYTLYKMKTGVWGFHL